MNIQNVKMKSYRLKLIILISLVSIFVSVLITFIMMETLGSGIDLITLSISIIAPLVIAPSVTWYIVDLTVKIHALEEEQRKLASYDMLTGLLMRRVFINAFETMLRFAERNNFSISLAYIDIDDFKNINDSYGHATGDEVLKSIGIILKQSVRRSDIVGRIGGEEFAIALPNADMQSAIYVLDQQF